MDSFVQKSIKIIELLQKAAKDDTSEVASIAVCDGDCILMGKRRDNGRWTMPGGHLDKGEEKSDGAVRELFEESGIKVEPTDLKYLGSKDVVTHKGKKKLIHAFSYKHEGERPTTKHDPDKEVEKWEWIDCSEGIPKEVAENAHTPVDKNIVFEKMDLKPQEELSKSDWQQSYMQHLHKEEGPVKLVHYGKVPGLKMLDPKMQGSGAPSEEYKRGLPEVPRTYFYKEGTPEENIVKQGAKSKYTATLQPHQKLYDLNQDHEGLVQEAINNNQGAWNTDAILNHIKNKGYHGFHNSASSLPGVVALFHPHPVEREESYG